MNSTIFEGALNPTADVPPTTSTTTETSTTGQPEVSDFMKNSHMSLGAAFSQENLLAEEAKAAKAAEATAPAAAPANQAETTNQTQPAAGDDPQAATGAEGSLNNAPGDPASERGPIPYERFREVNEKAQKAAEYEQQATEYREAAELGIPLVQYKQLASAAEQTGFADVPTYIEAVQLQQQLAAEEQRIQAEIQKTESRYDVTEEYRQQLLTVQSQALVTARQQTQLQQQMFQQNARVAAIDKKERAAHMTAAREAFPNLTPKLERLLNATETHLLPEVIAEFRASMAPGPDTEKLKQDAIAEYASKKAADAAIVAPEGRGGSAPPPSALATTKDAWKQSFSNLMGYGRQSG